MKTAVTISIVPEARQGPFVFHGDWEKACTEAKTIGFDAVELFFPGPDAVPLASVKQVLVEHRLSVAAIGTGAGFLQRGLTLTHADAAIRRQATDFIRSMIEFGAALGAPAILGSMQGRFDSRSPQPTALVYLQDALAELGTLAESLGQPFFYEPLNRYETNLCNTLEDGKKLIHQLAGVKLLADLFHMNIEEADLPRAIREASPHVGHVHWADSNRRPGGLGHTHFKPIVDALRASGYSGYISAECFPIPDSTAAARQSFANMQQQLR
ncbi:MAG: TIM barrel protein [Gemmataceae bacterium]